MECDIRKTCRKDPKFVGLDLSYTGTGLIVLDSQPEILEQKLVKTNKEFSTEERILQIEKEISFIPNIIGLHSVFVEGPAYSSQGNQMLQMGALNFYVRIFLLKHKIPYTIIAPPTLKKFACGTGRAQKDFILLNVYKKWDVSFEDNNLADAYVLARMALEVYNSGQFK